MGTQHFLGSLCVPQGQRATTVLDVVGRTQAHGLHARCRRTADGRNERPRGRDDDGLRSSRSDASYRPRSGESYHARLRRGGPAGVREQSPVSNALGYTSTTVYDAAGRAGAGIDPLGYRTTFSYDTAGRRIAEIGPLA